MNEDTAKAKTMQAENSTSFQVPDSAVVGGSVVGGALVLVGILMQVRRMWSNSNLQVVKDRAETDLVATLKADRDKAYEERERALQTAESAWSRRTADAEQIGKLTAEVTHLSRTNEQMSNDMRNLRQEVKDLHVLIQQLLKPEYNHLLTVNADGANLIKDSLSLTPLEGAR